MEARVCMRIEPVFAKQKFSGSAFQVTEDAFLSCAHVADNLPTNGTRVAASRLNVGSNKLAVRKVIRSSTADLALLVLKEPQQLDPIRFSRQWDIGGRFLRSDSRIRPESNASAKGLLSCPAVIFFGTIKLR